jgi:hypothetical protein
MVIFVATDLRTTLADALKTGRVTIERNLITNIESVTFKI